MISRKVALAFLVLPLWTSSPAQASDEPTAAPGNEICELHVWPANDLRSTYHGWFHGGIVDGAVQGRGGYRKLPESPLASARQAEVLRTSSLSQVLHLTGYRTIVHDTALDSRTTRQSMGRIQADAPLCYAELVVDDVFFQEDVASGRFLKVLYRYREFAGDMPSRRFGTYIQTRLLRFPPKIQAGIDAAFEELVTAYHQSVAEFGQALNKPAKTGKSKRN